MIIQNTAQTPSEKIIDLPRTEYYTISHIAFRLTITLVLVLNLIIFSQIINEIITHAKVQMEHVVMFIPLIIAKVIISSCISKLRV